MVDANVSQNTEQQMKMSGLGKLPRFDGRTSIRQFLNQINKRAKLEQWDDERKAELIRYLCTDLAESFLDSNPELEECSLEVLCERLNARFQPKIKKPEAYTELFSIRQGRDSVAEYAGKIETVSATLSDALNELKNPETREELLVSVFMTGLEPNCKRILLANEYKTFSDCVRAAKRVEKSNNESRIIGNISEQTVNQNNENHNRTPRNYNQSGMGYNNPNRPRVKCWNCGEEGHIMRFCNKPPNEQMRNGYFKNNYNNGYNGGNVPNHRYNNQAGNNENRGTKN